MDILATFDNRSTTAEIEFLANVWHGTQREDCKHAVLRGLDYVLAAQYPNGGWPQVYPLEGGYHDNITLNDDAMTNILALLQLVTSGDPVMECVDANRKKRCDEALNKGLECVGQLQVVRDGVKSAWCAQHDPRTLAPVAARAMEPASLGSVESSNLLKFLMTIPHPDPELVACIEGGLAWLEKVAIKDMRREKVDGKTAYIKDSASTELMWARFYSLENDKPLYPGRDGVIYDSYEEMARNNKLGYDFLSTRPGSVVSNGQKKWRKMLAKEKSE